MRKISTQPKQLFITDLGQVQGGGLPNPVPRPTTLALGEEDGGGSNPPTFTTLALGEEDGNL